MTAETILRAFQSYGLRVERRQCGHVIFTTHLSSQQRQILLRLNFPTPTQLLSVKLPHIPP
jgi:hypothetical protein